MNDHASMCALINWIISMKCESIKIASGLAERIGKNKRWLLKYRTGQRDRLKLVHQAGHGLSASLALAEPGAGVEGRWAGRALGGGALGGGALGGRLKGGGWQGGLKGGWERGGQGSAPEHLSARDVRAAPSRAALPLSLFEQVVDGGGSAMNAQEIWVVLDANLSLGSVNVEVELDC